MYMTTNLERHNCYYSTSHFLKFLLLYSITLQTTDLSRFPYNAYANVIANKNFNLKN